LTAVNQRDSIVFETKICDEKIILPENTDSQTKNAESGRCGGGFAARGLSGAAVYAVQRVKNIFGKPVQHGFL
jgi:hypothetical protein